MAIGSRSSKRTTVAFRFPRFTMNVEDGARNGSGTGPHRIDESQALEVLLVVGDDGAIVGLGDGGQNHVERATRPP